jgi:hypothetical protein
MSCSTLSVRAAAVGLTLTAGLAVACERVQPTEVARDSVTADSGVVGGVASLAAAETVTVRLERFDSSEGLVLVSNGIPLRRGRLFETDMRRVRVLIDGQEQAIRTEALAGRHADGSLRSILLQFMYDVPSGGNRVDAQLILGEARTTPDLADPQNDRTQLTAVALPVDANYLVTTELSGPTVTVTRSRLAGAAYARYEADFAQFADYHWKLQGANWTEDYYDRALIYYAFWLRSANPEYFRRATLLAVAYRTQYLEPNDYGSSPHWSQLEGLEQHYLLTGDEKSRVAIARVAEVMNAYHSALADTVNSTWLENRIQARVLQSYLLALRLTAEGPKALDWKALLDDGLNRTLQTQRADGSYGFPNTCYASLNYMAGVLNDVMIKMYTLYRADERIPSAIRKSADYMWRTQWLDDARAFKYVSADCEGTGGPTPAPDLNNLIVTSFSWTAQQSGDGTYEQRAEQIFAGAVNGGFIDGTKQFNQEYTTSFRHLSYRLAPGDLLQRQPEPQRRPFTP